MEIGIVVGVLLVGIAIYLRSRKDSWWNKAKREHPQKDDPRG